jgi:hypothetical protein
MSSPPKCAAILDDRVDVVAAGDVERPGFCGSAAGEDLGSNRLRAFRAEIGDRDLGAFSREHPRRGAAHATGRTGDENGQSLHRPAELFEVGHELLAGDVARLAGLTRLAPIPREVKPSKKREGEMNELDFSDRQILVIGGSSGIGNGIAQAFRAKGARVHVCGTRAPPPIILRARDRTSTVSITLSSTSAMHARSRISGRRSNGSMCWCWRRVR